MKTLIDIIDIEDNVEKKFQMKTTLKTLFQVDDVINYHSNNTASEQSLIVINIYGLLQSLFVGIDSLYQLVIGLTNHKFNINVNQNQTLNELKHIRNDIVGHPTNRRYGSNGVAFSAIDNSKLTYNLFKYDTYLFDNNEMEKREVIVNLDTLKKEYSTEKEIIIKSLTNYLLKDEFMLNLDVEILDLFYDSTIANLEIVKNKFINHYSNVTQHRFYWRLDLIKTALDLQSNDILIDDLYNYILKQQIIKLLSISNEMENKYMKPPYVKIPTLLYRFYKFLDKNPEYLEYIDNLHDQNSRFYQSDLKYLLKTIKDESVLKVLNLLNNTNRRDIIYLIGSVIKNYKKK